MSAGGDARAPPPPQGLGGPQQTHVSSSTLSGSRECWICLYAVSAQEAAADVLRDLCACKRVAHVECLRGQYEGKKDPTCLTCMSKINQKFIATIAQHGGAAAKAQCQATERVAPAAANTPQPDDAAGAGASAAAAATVTPQPLKRNPLPVGTILHAVFETLIKTSPQEKKSGLSSRDIVKRVVGLRKQHHNGEMWPADTLTPHNSVDSVVGVDIRTNGEHSWFRRVAPGRFSLRDDMNLSECWACECSCESLTNAPLICCETCVLAFHAECHGYRNASEAPDDWKCFFCHAPTNTPSVGKLMLPEKRSLSPLDLHVGDAVRVNVSDGVPEGNDGNMRYRLGKVASRTDRSSDAKRFFHIRYDDDGATETLAALDPRIWRGTLEKGAWDHDAPIAFINKINTETTTTKRKRAPLPPPPPTLQPPVGQATVDSEEEAGEEQQGAMRKLMATANLHRAAVATAPTAAAGSGPPHALGAGGARVGEQATLLPPTTTETGVQALQDLAMGCASHGKPHSRDEMPPPPPRDCVPQALVIGANVDVTGPPIPPQDHVAIGEDQSQAIGMAHVLAPAIPPGTGTGMAESNLPHVESTPTRQKPSAPTSDDYKSLQSMMGFIWHKLVLVFFKNHPEWKPDDMSKAREAKWAINNLSRSIPDNYKNTAQEMLKGYLEMATDMTTDDLAVELIEEVKGLTSTILNEYRKGRSESHMDTEENTATRV